MAKVQFEIDTNDILEDIEPEDIVDAFVSDIEHGDCYWWTDRVANPIGEKVLKLLEDKNSDFYKEVVQQTAAIVAENINIASYIERVIGDKIVKKLNL